MLGAVASLSPVQRNDSRTSQFRRTHSVRPGEAAAMQAAKISVFEKMVQLDEELKKRTWICFAFAIIALPFVAVEFEFMIAYNFQWNYGAEAAKGVISLTSLASVFALYSMYRTMYSHAILSNRLHEGANFANTYLMRGFVIESIVLLLHLPIGVNFTFPSVDTSYPPTPILYSADLLQMIVFCRLYLIPRLLHVNTRLGGGTGRWLRSFAYLDISWSFTLKSYLQQYPYRVLSFAFVCVFPLLAYSQRMCDWPIEGSPQHYWVNAMWLAVVSMTTLAFGEVVPRTHCSRFMNWVGTFWGTLLTSFVIVSVISHLMPSETQTRAINTVMKAHSRKEFFESAARCIQAAWAHKRLLRNPLSSAAAVERARVDVTHAVETFRGNRRALVAVTHTSYEQLSYLDLPSRTYEIRYNSARLQDVMADVEDLFRHSYGLPVAPRLMSRSSMRTPSSPSIVMTPPPSIPGHPSVAERLSNIEALVEKLKSAVVLRAARKQRRHSSSRDRIVLPHMTSSADSSPTPSERLLP